MKDMAPPSCRRLSRVLKKRITKPSVRSSTAHGEIGRWEKYSGTRQRGNRASLSPDGRFAPFLGNVTADPFHHL
jgi:hypothetical protein